MEIRKTMLYIYLAIKDPLSTNIIMIMVRGVTILSNLS